MTARPAAGRADQAALLLRDLDRIEPPISHPLRKAADLAECEADPLEQLWMLLDQELRAELTSRLFVARQREDQVSGRRLCRRAQERRDEHRDAPLHIEGAATPDDVVDEITRERVVP